MTTPTTTGAFEALAAALPSAEQHLDWIDQLVALGIRRPGTRESTLAAGWCCDVLRSFGLAVTVQPVVCTTSHPGPAVLEARLVDEPDTSVTLEGLTVPFSTATPARRFTLRHHGEQMSDVDAALVHARFAEVPTAWFGEAMLGRHDPADEFASHVHVMPFGDALGKEIDAVVTAGAGAMVGVVDAPWTTSQYFVPYDGEVRPIPGIWVDREQGAVLDRLLARGEVEIELTTTVDTTTVADHNVIATAPASSVDDWVVIGSHYDAPWASAVEDASGVAQVLAQAAAWATLPPEQRPISVAFLLTAAHMSEAAGTRAFIDSWEHRERIRVAIHLEHVAAEAVPDGDGGLVPTDRPEVRWWFASAPDAHHQDTLVRSIVAAIEAEDVDRSMVLPPESFGPIPPTDGGYFHAAGIPMINLLAAPMYLFDPCDRPEMVHRPSLVPVARAALRLTIDACDRWAKHEPADG